jgi:hypothetical protein
MVDHNNIERTELDNLVVEFLHDKENENKPLAMTGGYDPDNKKILVYVSGRHIKDILRSLAHELQHFVQDCLGKLSGGVETSEGYAQKDKHLRGLEKDAYLTGNILFRDWEDAIKIEREGEILKENKMIKQISAKNNELNRVLMENIAKRTKNKVLLEQIAEERTFPDEGTRMDKIRWISDLNKKQYIDGIEITPQVAKTMIAVWNQLNKASNKDKFESLPIKTLVDFCLEQVKKIVKK